MSRVIDDLSSLGTELGPEWHTRIVRLGLSALSSRALVWAAALGAGAVWTFAAVHPDGLRLLAATGYCLTVLAPILWRDAKEG